MSRLTNLYQAIDTLKSEGIRFNESQNSQLHSLERNIIEIEVLPTIKNSLEPLLNIIERKIEISVIHTPKEEISVELKP